jgi:hypothetical protein
MVILNIILFIFVTLFYTAVIVGYGAQFKNKIFHDDKDSIGEFGIYGFIILYFISILVHFFLPINFFVNLPILGLGVYFFFKRIEIKKIKNFANNKFLFFIFLFFLLSFTNQFHDDAYLYHLPYINYLQKFKIIFGLVTVNDYLAYGHGFFDILALFKLPKISNSLIFTLPVIFLAFFIIYLYEHRKKNNFYNNFFISIIVSVLLFRYYQSKDYGTDLPVLILIFLIQINLLNYFFNKNINYFYKSVLFFLTGIFFKVYMLFAVFYLLLFFLLTKLKKIQLIKHKRIISFLIMLVFLSFGKNFIHSGCLIYPVHQTCMDSKSISWSYGKDLSKKRMIFLEAASKGWLSNYRFSPESKFIEPDKYLEKYKYNYYKNLILDQDFFHLILVTLIFLVLYILNRIKEIKVNNYEKILPNIKKYLFFTSFVSLLFWFMFSPHLRYGGYGFIIFLLFSIFINFNLIKKTNFKNIKVFIFIGLTFFIIKNIDRTYKEISKEKFSGIPKFKNFSYTNYNYLPVNINVSDNNIFCGNIEMLCVVKSNLFSIKYIENNFSYLFIKKNKNEIFKHMNLELEKMKMLKKN